MSHENSIYTVDEQTPIFVYIWNRCKHSNDLIRDLQQLPESLQNRIECIDVGDMNMIDNLPPGIQCTPCLYVGSQGKIPPQICNGRKSILLFCKLRGYNTVNTTMDIKTATGKKQIESIFEKTFVNETDTNGRHDMTKIAGLRNFAYDEEQQKICSGKREKLFNDFIDDPTIATDPRISSGDVKEQLEKLMSSRGYS
jgi:hypothetical protein